MGNTVPRSRRHAPFLRSVAKDLARDSDIREPPTFVCLCWARCSADAHLKCLNRRRSPGSAPRSRIRLERRQAPSHGGVSSQSRTEAHSLIKQGFTMFPSCRRRQSKESWGLAHPLPREFPEENWTSALRIVPSTRFHSAPSSRAPNWYIGAPRRTTMSSIESSQSRPLREQCALAMKPATLWPASPSTSTPTCSLTQAHFRRAWQCDATQRTGQGGGLDAWNAACGSQGHTKLQRNQPPPPDVLNPFRACGAHVGGGKGRPAKGIERR